MNENFLCFVCVLSKRVVDEVNKQCCSCCCHCVFWFLQLKSNGCRATVAKMLLYLSCSHDDMRQDDAQKREYAPPTDLPGKRQQDLKDPSLRIGLEVVRT